MIQILQICSRKKSEWVLPHMLILIRLQWLIHGSSSLCISILHQTCCWLFIFIVIIYLFKSLVGGNGLYWAVPLWLVGNNSLIYTLNILASIELFLNCKFYSSLPVLIDVFNNGKKCLRKTFVQIRFGHIFCVFGTFFSMCQPIDLLYSKCCFIKYERQFKSNCKKIRLLV